MKCISALKIHVGAYILYYCKKKRSLIRKFRYVGTQKQYSIEMVDFVKHQMTFAEKGMSFYLSFNEIPEHTYIFNHISQHDMIILGFILSHYNHLANMNIEVLADLELGTDEILILESEDRAGKFHFFNVHTKKEMINSIQGIFLNAWMIRYLSYHDLFHIGISTGKNKKNAHWLKHYIIDHYSG